MSSNDFLKTMSEADKSVKAAAVMPKSLKSKLKVYADSKRWTMSQAIVYFVEKGLDEENSNEDNEPVTTSTSKKVTGKSK